VGVSHPADRPATVAITPRPRVFLAVLAALALAALASDSISTIMPPAAAPITAPADQFSADRAFVHVQAVGQRVHVAGSAAAASVRSYIEDYLKGLGLTPAEQEGVGQESAAGGVGSDGSTGDVMAHVHDVVAVLPGTAPTGRVFLVAHYDSVQVSYGGNDDGAGVATLLETARAMTSGLRPRNDVVFLFTDAEEACLCGAEAFVSQNPLAADGGVLLNLESRGSSGPAIMFETSQGNAGVVDVYARNAVHPVATSFAVEVYRILPNNTDFTPFRESGRFTGLNTAYIDGSAVYHSPYDTPSTMDVGSLQQHGDNALALARAFSAAELGTLAKPSADDLTYLPVLGYLARYPGTLVPPIAAVAFAAVLLLAILARWRRKPYLGAPDLGRGLTTWPRILGGIVFGLVPLALVPLLAQALWRLLLVIRPGYGPMLDPWQPGWFRAGVVALVATVLLSWYGLLRRHLGGWALIIGGLFWLAVLGLVLAWLAPGGSYLTALPALAVAAALIVGVFLPRHWLALVAATLGAAVAVVVLAPAVALFFPALGLAGAGAPALVTLLLGFAVLPVLEYLYPAPPPVTSLGGSAMWAMALPRRRLATSAPALLAALLSVAFVGAGLATDRFDAAHPVQTQLMYALDTDTGQAHWVSTETSPGSWTSQYVTGHDDLTGAFPILPAGVATGPAQVAQLPAPSLTVVSDTTDGSTRHVELLVQPQRQVRLVYLKVTGATVTAANADGRDLPASAVGGASFALLFHAPPSDGLTVRLTLSGTGHAHVRVMDGSDGLDGLPGFVARPTGVGVKGSHFSELVLVAKTYDLA
jgi:hypothetical protein